VDFSIEIDFVKKHIKKEYQERIIFELQSKKNREKAISRFSHSSDMILKDQFVKCTMAELQNHLADSCGVKEECYMISEDMLDGQILPLHDAVEYCLTSYLAVILISSKFALVKEEAECSEPRIFISK
jgi:hypothetical protein